MVSKEILDIEEDFYESNCYVRDAYKRFYQQDDLINGGPYQIHLHSNGLCFFTLAPTHPIIKDNLMVKSIEFSDQRLSNQVSGKRKRGGQFLRQESILCTVFTNCEQKFVLRASMDAKLVEINKELLTKPEEIKSPTLGFIAILETKWVDVIIPHEKWISEEEFTKSQQEIPIPKVQSDI